LDFDSTTNRNVAITYPKCPRLSPNFGNFDLKFLIPGLQRITNWPLNCKLLRMMLPKLSLFKKQAQMINYLKEIIRLTLITVPTVKLHPFDQLQRQFLCQVLSQRTLTMTPTKKTTPPKVMGAERETE